jgi:hypothetical protein
MCSHSYIRIRHSRLLTWSSSPIKCYTRRYLSPPFYFATTSMTPESRLRSLTLPVSVSITKWLPNLGSFYQLCGHHTASLRPLPAPGSLRDAHNSACAWFLGPKAENADAFRMSVDTILDDVIHFRRNFAVEDEVCVRILRVSNVRRPHSSSRRISSTQKPSPRPRSRRVWLN